MGGSDDDYNSVGSIESIHDVGTSALEPESFPWMHEGEEGHIHEFESDDDEGAAGQNKSRAKRRTSRAQRAALAGHTSSLGRVSGVSDVIIPDGQSGSGSQQGIDASRSTQ